MSKIYEQVKTPFKYGLVLAPTDNHHKMDCPTVFRRDNKWYMTFVIYNGKTGTDGRGYETWMAESDNLLDWKINGRVLAYRDSMWDCNQRGGFPALPDINWGGSYELQPYKGKYWMTYIGGPTKGYESAPLSIGLAWTNKKDLAKAKEWKSGKTPILTNQDKDAQWFENLIQYKSTVYWDKEKKLGYPFVMFYNAGGKHPDSQLKGERIGIALSSDLEHWKRYKGNPVFSHEIQGMITGDAQIQKFGDLYVIFYFSAFNPEKPYKAYNTFACSYDLIHWYDWKGEDLIIPSKPYDNLFAHKSCVINYNGTVYHFYCAVNKNDQRGIAVATSKALGRSTLNFPTPEIKQRRIVQNLNENWKTWMDQDTISVKIPHNWDDYYGARQLIHGNLHGTATYSTTFVAPNTPEKEFFIRFEGIGTYATVFLNDIKLGKYISGRTTFTIDVTKQLIPGKANSLKVIAEHPEMISDMPWVCGGCSSEWGFSEGSQPLGIFRPVVLEVTDKIRIEPFGVHIWNNDRADSIFIDTEVKNYLNSEATFELVNKLNNSDGRSIFRLAQKVTLQPGESTVIRQQSYINQPQLWSLENPYLYQLATMIKRNENSTTDEITTAFGIRTCSWPVKRQNDDGKFYLNGKPTFINGVCEYEHLFGQSHAFTDEQIQSRIKQIKNAGFNAFREAHQPHNLLYQKLLDESGVLSWSQFSAHIWYDTPEFRENFKTLLRQWIKERRNSPSIVMWGLQNESVLPTDFAKECSEIIREMDPTSRTMRVITTCNGGSGTDWNVVQNWSGTYGGNIETYGNELSSPNQLLNGEYGAWRTLDLHTETQSFDQNGKWSENRACTLLEKKIKQAEAVKDSICGQFQWIYNSHDNPGRQQPDEAYRLIDKVGPFNYKGLVTPWEEPTDAYYLYRSNYVSAKTDPMVYIVSHTWPNRFEKRRRADVEVFSNCDSVKLYNDATDSVYLGRKKNNGVGTHFIWENRDIRYNVVRAVGYSQGKASCEDVLVLNHLEKAPHFDHLYQNTPANTEKKLLKGDPNLKYIYRINCGGDDYVDEFQQTWLKDDTTYSHSWAESFKDINPYQASQRETYDPIKNTRDWSLLGHFRFGRYELHYNFEVPNGEYRIELFFTEPWHGTGGGIKTDCEGLRIFDVAVNDSTVLNDLDIWAETGHDAALKKTIYTTVHNGKINITFPEIKSGQAIISAIAIGTLNKNTSVIRKQQSDWSWQKADTMVLDKTPKEALPQDSTSRKSKTYTASNKNQQSKLVEVRIKDKNGLELSNGKSIEWNIQTGLAQIYALRFTYSNGSGKPLKVKYQLVDASGTVINANELTFSDTSSKWKQLSTTTGQFINAGNYKVVLTAPTEGKLVLNSLEIQ